MDYNCESLTIENLVKIRDAVKEKEYESARSDLNRIVSELKTCVERYFMPEVVVNISRAAKSFAKHCHKEKEYYRPGIDGAGYYDYGNERRQYICDEYVGVSYSKPIAGLVEADAAQPLKFDQLISGCRFKYRHEVRLPSLAELKYLVRIETAWNGSGSEKKFVKLAGERYVEAERLIWFMELTGCTGGETAYSDASPVNLIYIYNRTQDEGEIDAVVLPSHPVEDNLLLHDYSK